MALLCIQLDCVVVFRPFFLLSVWSPWKKNKNKLTGPCAQPTDIGNSRQHSYDSCKCAPRHQWHLYRIPRHEYKRTAVQTVKLINADSYVGKQSYLVCYLTHHQEVQRTHTHVEIKLWGGLRGFRSTTCSTGNWKPELFVNINCLKIKARRTILALISSTQYVGQSNLTLSPHYHWHIHCHWQP